MADQSSVEGAKTEDVRIIVKDMKLAKQGKDQIALAERNMPALVNLGAEYTERKPFDGMRIGLNLHVTKETAVLVKALMAGGADVAITGCNAFSTQDDVAAALADAGARVFCIHGCSNEEYYSYIDRIIAFQPHILIDDGCDLCVAIHEAPEESRAALIGGCEQTTSGVFRLRNMEKSGALKYPWITTNENKTKHLLDNYYGTGQSVWDAIMRATTLFVAGKTAVCVGYGACGKGIALRAKGLGAKVVVTEVDPFAALCAVYDGFTVMPIAEAAKVGDFFITATGNKHAISLEDIKQMKDGAVLSNAGQFNYEIDVAGLQEIATAKSAARENMEQLTLPSGRSVFLLGGGNLVNLSCAEGHPSEVMATSFLGQAIACEHLVKHQKELAAGCVPLPPALDDHIAALQLEALGIKYDTLTAEQTEYMDSWKEGTHDDA